MMQVVLYSLLLTSFVFSREILQDSQQNRVTRRGCVCVSSWTISDTTVIGCGNPDNDPVGEWCVVDPATCTLASAGQLVESGGFQGRYFDYCVEPVDCTQTRARCNCKTSWPYNTQVLYGCANPDNDPKGEWCLVEEDTCEGKPAGPARNANGDLLGTFDYCIPGCEEEEDGSLTDIEIPQISVSVTVGNTFQVCKTTTAGCACRPQWTYDGNNDGTIRSYYGCARTAGDTVGPWCPITDVESCTNGDPHTVKLGAETADPWDYCDLTCSPPNTGTCSTTNNGCKCIEVWEYDGIQYQGCTRPDADGFSAWCIVDPETCTSGQPSGQLPGSESFWDACPATC
eukprot:TRINITY_DN2206_c0_g1_i2.p2 TRINITY_DN2206_c0_g1~~TRINITY_DN2206_c0_g1_i2.p2  ORF type:complete len:342 (+),score=30.85 TRINITY_DN2206_c0_g1_i2:155-1180(+)